jgi:heme/copper-type cytochrome/quinol oxidase subunit 4
MFLTSTDAFSSNTKIRNYIIAFLAGTITGIAWWIIIDILVRSTEHLFARVYILPGIAITLMLIILHFIPDTAMQDDNGMINIFSSNTSLCGCGSTKCARFSLFLAFLIIFSAVVASIWIFMANYANTDDINKKARYVQWFGVGNIVYTVLLAIAALLSRFGRTKIDSMMI